MTDLQVLAKALERLQRGFSSFPDTFSAQNHRQIEEVLLKTAERMQDNFPYFQPQYAGQMLKPPHAVARLAYMLALYVNPNNHALDGGRASSAMEKEAVAKLAQMFTWDDYLGHLTSGGTVANMEALWVARSWHPDKKVVASEQAHYTHERISAVLGLGFEKIPCRKDGKMDIESLERSLKKGDVGTVILTMGTTGTGSVEPLSKVLELRAHYDFRIHLDAAYGGYFVLSESLPDAIKKEYALMKEADSIVIDPHKHGLQPYGCGCVLFRDPAVGRFYKHDSPYTYFSSADLHLGEISLECSRAGAAAVALWATLEMFPLERGGDFARQVLDPCQEAARLFYQEVLRHEHFIPLLPPELDIVVWAPRRDSFSQISEVSRAIFKGAARQGVHLALINYPAHLLPDHWSGIEADQTYVTCLRTCLMKPEHKAFVPALWDEIVRQEAELKS